MKIIVFYFNSKIVGQEVFHSKKVNTDTIQSAHFNAIKAAELIDRDNLPYLKSYTNYKIY